MFVEVSSLTYHSPITIFIFTYVGNRSHQPLHVRERGLDRWVLLFRRAGAGRCGGDVFVALLAPDPAGMGIRFSSSENGGVENQTRVAVECARAG